MRTVHWIAGAHLFAASPAAATPFTFTVKNNSAYDWSEGVAAVLDDTARPNVLLEVGATPTGKAAYSTYTYGHQTCDPGGEDDGDAAQLIAGFGLTENVDAWVVPALAPRASAEITVEATAGQVLSFVAYVEGSDDDVVAMHAIGDVTDTAVVLFNHLDLPVFTVQFDIAGYDLNSVDPDRGTGSSCAPDCPATGTCFVAPDNTTTRLEAGGDQDVPPDPELGVFPGYVLTPEAGTFYANGVGSPAVVHRKTHGDYLLFFETMLADPTTDCPVGTWGIGMATSPDGWHFTVSGNAALIRPTLDTYYRCVAAHPAAVIDDDGDHVHLWFKGEQGNDCDPLDPPSWGCESRYVGVGYAAIDPDAVQVTTITTDPLQLGDTFGFPTVTRVNGLWTMMLQKYPDFYVATAAQPAGPWTLDPDPALSPGVTSWSLTELFNPSLVCEGDATVPAFAYTNWFGGRSRDFLWGPIVDGGLGEAISTNATSWFIGVTPFRWDNDDEWRHWDAHRVGDDTLLYFAEKVGGANHIGLASSTSTWNEDDIATKICPQPSWW